MENEIKKQTNMNGKKNKTNMNGK